MDKTFKALVKVYNDTCKDVDRAYNYLKYVEEEYPTDTERIKHEENNFARYMEARTALERVFKECGYDIVQIVTRQW